MKVFISWSGDLSKQLGECFRDWLPGVLQLVKPYFTPNDIEKGARWNSDIAKELETSSVGLFCLTRENLESSWLLFEAGALSKSLNKTYVCPIIFDLDNTDLKGPLGQFQTTVFKKTEIKKLLKTINAALGENKLDDKVLDDAFDIWWPKLEEKIEKILKGAKKKDTKPLRSDRELLEEVVELSRLSARRFKGNTVVPEALKDLLESYVNIYHMVNDNEPSGEIMGELRRMRGPLSYITKNASLYSNVGVRKYLAKVANFTFGEDDDEGDDVPLSGPDIPF